jgi:hypothetical protein
VSVAFRIWVVAMNLNRDRAESIVPWTAGVLFALPVLIAKYPPMADLPLHEASVGLWHHWGDARFAPPTVYFLNLGQANQLFSFLVFALAYVFPIAWASKLIVAGCLFALPLAAAHFSTYLGASRWPALLVAPLGLGWLFFWGLVQNILGLAALLWLLPVIDRFASRPTAKGLLATCTGMVLLHFAHQAMLIVACAALVMCSVGTTMRPKALALRASSLAFCVALVALGKAYASRVEGPRAVTTPPYRLTSVLYKLETIPGVLFGGYDVYIRNLVMALALAPVVLFAIKRVQRREPSEGTLSLRIHRWRFEWLAVVLFGVFLAAPITVRTTTLVYHRFLPPVWSLVAICAAARGAGAAARPLARALCTIVPVASLLIAWPSFADSDRVYRDLDAVMAPMQPGAAVMTLDLGPGPPRPRLWSPVNAMGHIVAVLGGRSLYDYTISPVSPVAQRPNKQWTEPADRMAHDPFRMRPDWDLARFRYLLIATPKPSLAAAVTVALQDDARLLAAAGDWYLFESRLALVPIDANDAPLPTPHPASLRRKLRDLAAHREGPDPAADPPTEP